MSVLPKVLLVDDDEDILELLRYNLIREEFEVRAISDSQEALMFAHEYQPDLVVLDLMMPGLNGIEICRQMRSDNLHKNIYIFFLTAKSDEYYKHATFNVGGDDCIEKITGIKPLLNKIHAVLKRNFIIRKQSMKIKMGSLELFRGAETVYLDGSKILLNKPEFEILFFFAQNAGRKIFIQDIIQTLWGSDTFMDARHLKTHMSNLQNKIGNYLHEAKPGDCYLFKIAG